MKGSSGARDDILSPYAASGAKLERLECLPVVVCKYWVSKPSFRVEVVGIGKNLIVMIQRPMVYGNNGLLSKKVSKRAYNATRNERLAFSGT